MTLIHSTEVRFGPCKPSRNRMMAPDDHKIMEKMCTYMMLMAHNVDNRAAVPKDLNRSVWIRKCNFSWKRCQKLLYLLYSADSYALLSFNVSLGMSVWRDHLKAKRRRFEKVVAERIKRRIVKKKLRRVRVKRMFQKKNEGVLKSYKGYQVRRVLGSRIRVVMRPRGIRHYGKVEFGSPVYRLAMSLYVLSLRNLCITSEWELWVICLMKEVFGFWKSIAIKDGLCDSLISTANKFGLYVVSQQSLERLDSCHGCSSSVHYTDMKSAKKGYLELLESCYGCSSVRCPSKGYR